MNKHFGFSRYKGHLSTGWCRVGAEDDGAIRGFWIKTPKGSFWFAPWWWRE